MKPFFQRLGKKERERELSKDSNKYSVTFNIIRKNIIRSNFDFVWVGMNKKSFLMTNSVYEFFNVYSGKKKFMH